MTRSRCLPALIEIQAGARADIGCVFKLKLQNEKEYAGIRQIIKTAGFPFSAPGRGVNSGIVPYMASAVCTVNQ